MGTSFEPVDALLAVDVGNSRVGLAVWDDDGLHETRHIEISKPSAWRETLEQVWSTTTGARKRTIVMGSVNVGAARDFSDLAVEVCNIEPLRVRDDLPLPMPLDVENTRQVGVDRVCSAAAAFDRVDEPCAVASFGTATTIDCVSAEGRFLGGAILPGLEMSCEALHAHTSGLPRVVPSDPCGAFGRNTHDAIVNGVAYAAAGSLREIVEQFATELGTWPKLLVTGGAAPLVAKLADFIDAHVPGLCLMGIALAYRKAAGQT